MSTYNPNSIIPPGTPTTPTTATTSTNGVPIQTATKDRSLLGKDDFLKLLVGQLQNQDPMQPSGNDEFIGQMTAFSQLEQQTNTATTTGKIADQLAHTSALGLIGHTVTWTDGDGNDQTGKVDQVDMGDDGSATLTVGDATGIDVGKVTQVK
ncbi:MAG: flagellar basal-body rod modification protein FlgD [Thermoleophilaceae bacterium]|jgi:flagellar basal-body rod modification protein FlgD|nr:flagellar basal-body rod modification protein FlgD [Thermoleophilaceae bacterium]